ncbi:MAG: FAD-binding oxidoreductase [Bacteroidales bacterium]|nr:FAD-binding oxidoreductase [Bacteroidales bacterium]
MLTGNYKVLYERLGKKIDRKRIFHDPLHTLAFGTDASFYRLIPKMVIMANDEKEVSLIMHECSTLAVPVTFRASGTSLSGQAVSDSVMVIVGENWKGYQITDNGSKIKSQPGLTGGKINALLAPYGRKIGPDPASIKSATIGGIVANNASGMSSGTVKNAYNTIQSIRIILFDGTILDTGDNTSKDEFLKSHSHFIEEIKTLAKSVNENPRLSERIRKKFKIKNTTGYSLNALTDYTDPFDIIAHLMIGSEGTLGFISGITLNTVIEHPFKASALMIFPDIEKACTAVSVLKSTPVEAVELIDRSGLRSVENETGMPGYLKSLQQNACAILVETAADMKAGLDKQIQIILESIRDIPTEIPVHFTDVPEEYAVYWKIREGLFPSVGAMRNKGTTVIIEDVAFPIQHLAAATLDLKELLNKYRYDDSVIYGHALEGNLHFIFSQDFGINEEIERYEKLMSEVANLVLDKYDGSLKAEHGTGRNVAPFVEKEWGEEAYILMQMIKDIFDPQNMLNPGVIMNSDPKIHLKNLKPIPVANELIDKCIECGFCEPSCVSAGLTLTPRQRIVVYREMVSLKKSGHEPHIAAALAKSFSYEGDNTCATDGLCAASCPVKIDTGKLIKHLREEQIGSNQNMANWIAGHMSFVTASARVGLSVVNFFHVVLGTFLMKGISGGMRKISGNRIPFWNPFMPTGAKKIKINNEPISDNPRKVVYFPSCINRSMGVSRDHREEKQLSEKMISLLHKGGYEVIYPENLNNLCCGMAFLSKGYIEAGKKKSSELEAALLTASRNGEYPVLCDMSPCLYTMKDNMKSDLKLYEPVEFISDHLLPYLTIKPIDETITVFPVCSMKKLGLDGKLAELAKLCATKVIVADTNCCGFAGDRGFTYPELNKHGLRDLKNQMPETVKHGYSTSRTCEIGMSMHSGVSHKSICYLVDKASSPKTDL